METPLLHFTEMAAEHLLKLMKRDNRPQSSLRISVVGGGCSGFSYQMAFEDQIAEQDQVFEEKGVKLVIDSKSALFLKGLTVDFQDDLNGSGFVFQNPNAKKSCGCGSSFSV